MTTSLAYEELLAFDGLETAVDQLYRAYLDAVLVDAKQASKKDSSEFWRLVRDFRTKNLDLGTSPKYPEKAEARLEADAELAKMQTDREEKAALAEFLYWFDVRARFWSSEESSSLFLEKFPLGSELKLLLLQAQALEGRLKLIEELPVIKHENGRPAPDRVDSDFLGAHLQGGDRARASKIVALFKTGHAALEKLRQKRGS